jgi:prepilin-type N-terminal cleavage/methylation domain-containing protein
MTLRPLAPRRGFTLLEMTLALAIALIILGAVYAFLNRQITQAEIGRDLVDEYTYARRILDGIAADIVASLGGVDPKQLPDPPAPADPYVTEGTGFEALFNSGVSGSESTIILSAARIPDFLFPDKRNLDLGETTCDLRRVSYWLHDDGSGNLGLARQVVKGVTTGEFDETPPDVSDAEGLIVAGGALGDPCQIVGLLFEYFDGGEWQSAWDGSALAADGATPVGPPSAVRVTLTLKNRDGQTRNYRRTVALPAGNNFPAQLEGF